MAGEKINSERAGPIFVHVDRSGRSYTGPANPVHLWRKARERVKKTEKEDPPIDVTREEYLRLCVEEASGRLVLEWEDPESDAIHRIPVHREAHVLGTVGKTALGDSAEVA